MPLAPTIVVATAEAAGTLVADRVLDAYVATVGPFHLGCPAGRTPRTTYVALGRRATDRGIDLGRLVIVMMDEYLVGGALAPTSAHFSCRRFVDAHVLPHVGPRAVVSPDPADPGAHDEIPIDVFLLASGATDGHVAFNPPGSAIDTPTRVVELAASTRRDNLATFPDFASIDEVPRFGVTSGLCTITSAAGAILLLLGAGKAHALERLVACGGFDPAWPASVIHACDDALVVVDEAAVGGA
jgi:glucosamine-6-phosphate deaminase